MELELKEHNARRGVCLVAENGEFGNKNKGDEGFSLSDGERE